MIGHSHRLADGRRLGYAHYGDPGGRPVFIFLNANSRRFFPFDEALPGALGLVLINVDRPGIGYSDPKPGRTLLGWADDVSELADYLALEQFSVMGVGSGGPHAAACAWKLAGRVGALGLVSSYAPPGGPAPEPAWVAGLKKLAARTRGQPEPLTHEAMRQNSIKAWQNFHQRLPECDRELVRTYGPRYLKPSFMRDAYDELYRQGLEGVQRDDALMALPWGFSPADIRAPTCLWHGEADTLTPVGMGRYLAGCIPGAQARFLPGEGHLIYLKYWREMLEAVAERWAAGAA